MRALQCKVGAEGQGRNDAQRKRESNGPPTEQRWEMKRASSPSTSTALMEPRPRSSTAISSVHLTFRVTCDRQPPYSLVILGVVLGAPPRVAASSPCSLIHPHSPPYLVPDASAPPGSRVPGWRGGLQSWHGARRRQIRHQSWLSPTQNIVRQAANGVDKEKRSHRITKVPSVWYKSPCKIVRLK